MPRRAHSARGSRFLAPQRIAMLLLLAHHPEERLCTGRRYGYGVTSLKEIRHSKSL